MVLAGLLLWGCSPERQPASASAPAPEFRLLPEQRGRIERVALSLNSARRSAQRNAGLATAIVNALPASVDVRILTNDPTAFALRRGSAPLLRHAVELVSVASEHDLTIWPQDPFLTLEGPGGATRLLQSRAFERADDWAMARSLALALQSPLVESSLRFEGGNILADARQVFIGADTIRWNALEEGQSDVEVARRFEEELGLPVVVLGPVPQPVAHIDMMFSALGDGAVAVADAGWGAEIAAAALDATPDAVAAFEREVEAWFFGDPRIEELSGTSQTLSPPALAEMTSTAVADSRSLAPVFDALARALSQRGLSVHRIPILLTRAATSWRERDDARRPYARVLDYPILTYSNVLQEERDGRRRVFVPAYGFAALDEAGRTAWEALGREVIAVPGFATSALYGGALRCSAKVLARSDVPPPRRDARRGTEGRGG